MRALAPRGLHAVELLGVGERLRAHVVEPAVLDAGTLACAHPGAVRSGVGVSLAGGRHLSLLGGRLLREHERPEPRRSVRSTFSRRSTSRSFGVHLISTLAPVLIAVLLGLNMTPSRPKTDHSGRRRSLTCWPVRQAMS